MKFKIVCNYNTDYNIYNISKDIWNFDNKYDMTYGDDYTHLIIFNEYKGKINVPKENVFGFIQEPYFSNFPNWDLPAKCNKLFYWQPELFKKYNNIIKTPFVGNHHLFPKPPHIREVQYVKDNTKNIINSRFEKTRKLSIVVSNYKRDGEKYVRYDYVNKLLYSDLDFDMYGSGWNISDRRYKGRIDNKLDALKNYKYSICLENVSVDGGYITEKFMDSVLCRTIPIYHGSRDIDKIYPNSYEWIDYDNNFVNRIKEIINTNKDYTDYDMDNAISLYINEYNPMNIVKNNLI